jgi:hypothetical protein
MLTPTLTVSAYGVPVFWYLISRHQHSEQAKAKRGADSCWFLLAVVRVDDLYRLEINCTITSVSSLGRRICNPRVVKD